MRLFFILVFFLAARSFAIPTEEILAEGRLLFRLEKASWFGTDNFLANHPDKREKIGGYLSYESENHHITTIFFGRGDQSEILIRYEFDSIPESSPISVDTVNHTATDLEKDLIEIRQKAILLLTENPDEFFSFYRNTSPNPIPVITEKERKVFILTGPKVTNLVVLGNDYLLKFNTKNELIGKEKLHNTMLTFKYRADKSEDKMTSTMHTHVNSPYINSTDICTLLLYKDFVEWRQHIVMSKKYVSIFDLDTEQLIILTKKAWKKIAKDKKKGDK